LDFRRGESFDDHHRHTTLGTRPKIARTGGGGLLLGLRCPAEQVEGKWQRWWHVCGWPGSRICGCARKALPGLIRPRTVIGSATRYKPLRYLRYSFYQSIPPKGSPWFLCEALGHVGGAPLHVETAGKSSASSETASRAVLHGLPDFAYAVTYCLNRSPTHFVSEHDEMNRKILFFTNAQELIGAVEREKDGMRPSARWMVRPLR
jgi:hypothetical protein